MGVGAWSTKPCLGPTEIASFVFLVLFKDGGRSMSLIFCLYVSDVNQGNVEAGWIQGFFAWPQGWLLLLLLLLLFLYLKLAVQ